MLENIERKSILTAQARTFHENYTNFLCLFLFLFLARAEARDVFGGGVQFPLTVHSMTLSEDSDLDGETSQVKYFLLV